MMPTTNENFAKLIELLKSQGASAQARVSDSTEYKSFLAEYPPERIDHLSADEYCVGKGEKHSFCWWLERGLEPVLGRYMPGTSRGHIVYFRKGDGSFYKNRSLEDLTDQEALAFTLKVQKVIALADPLQDMRWIDDDAEIYKRAGVEPRVTVGNGRKLRLLASYHPEDVLLFASSRHVGHFLEQLGCSKEQIPEKARPVARMLLLRDYFRLAQQQVAGLSTRGFMLALYSPELGIAPVRQQDAKVEANDDEDEEMIDRGTSSARSRPPLNQILYGPPGTGKTYATIDAALEILAPEFLAAYEDRRELLKAQFDELVKAGYVEFVTFHQSFSYEDFVEGLRATADDKTGQIRYEVVDGIFKRMCDVAAAKVIKQETAPIDLAGRRIWKMSLGNTSGADADVYDECVEGGYLLLGYGRAIDFSGCTSKKEILELFTKAGYGVNYNDYDVTSVSLFLNQMQRGDLVVVSDGNLKFRAIGEVEGDYVFKQHAKYEDAYCQSRKVKWLRRYEPSMPHSELMKKQFSQMTLYVLGLNSIDIRKLEGLLSDSATPVGELPSAPPFRLGSSFGNGYSVVNASGEVLELKKPNGKSLPIGMSLIKTLAEYVRNKLISIEDIREKRVFEKVPDTKLEPYLVNGYANILPALVQRYTLNEGSVHGERDFYPRRDARVLIIDEINRGNIARIFGELITLIEPSKRAGSLEQLETLLPYSKAPFSVPSNVFLIGTMNTADRSLTGLDVALRRRFAFKEMPPRPDLLDDVYVEDLSLGSLLRAMNQRIEVLLDREHCLGHAYFMDMKVDGELLTKATLRQIFEQRILPLLQEYFFEDYERIGWVLNDPQAKVAGTDPFIHQSPKGTSLNTLFGAEVAASLRDTRWRVNLVALDSMDSYRNIVGQAG